MANIQSIDAYPSGVFIGEQAMATFLGLNYDSVSRKMWIGTTLGEAHFRFTGTVDDPSAINLYYEGNQIVQAGIGMGSTVTKFLHKIETVNGIAYGFSTSAQGIGFYVFQHFIDRDYDNSRHIYGAYSTSNTSNTGTFTSDSFGSLFSLTTSNGYSTTKFNSNSFINLNNIYLPNISTICRGVFHATCFPDSSLSSVFFTLNDENYISVKASQPSASVLCIKIPSITHH